MKIFYITFTFLLGLLTVQDILARQNTETIHTSNNTAADDNICNLHSIPLITELGSFRGMIDIALSIDDFVWKAPKASTMNTFWNFWNISKRREIYTDVLGKPCNDHGDTLLHLAVASPTNETSINLITVLINKHAPLDATNRDGETPLDIVKRKIGSEHLPNDTLDHYIFIHTLRRRNQDVSHDFTIRQLYQRICRSSEHTVHDELLSTVTSLIDEYDQWLEESDHLSIQDRDIFLDLYKQLRTAEHTLPLGSYFVPPEAYQHLRKKSQMCSKAVI